jgi:hypothetical protein
MPADQLRNRTVGSKMTESEYLQLVSVAEREGLTLGSSATMISYHKLARLHLVGRLWGFCLNFIIRAR